MMLSTTSPKKKQIPSSYLCVLLAFTAPTLLAEQYPDLADPGTVQRLLEEAVPLDLLGERQAGGERLFYKADSQTPFTGWAKRLHGNGKVKFLGNWTDGKADGTFTVWRENGTKAGVILYKAGKQEGMATKWHENGTKAQESTYKNGELEGMATHWHENGTKAGVMFYKAGKQEGTHTQWHENGTKAVEIFYKAGKLEGMATKWHENGNKAMEGSYKNGELEGMATTWHENGTKAREGSYKNGESEGMATTWHQSGTKATVMFYKAGKLEGTYTKWHLNGAKAVEGAYKNGQLEGPVTTWYENGTKAAVMFYSGGKQVFEDDPKLDDAKVLKKLLSEAVVWESLDKNELTGSYDKAADSEPYTGWFKKLHGNGKAALLGSLKDGKPDGLWTWWDENGDKVDERRY